MVKRNGRNLVIEAFPSKPGSATITVLDAPFGGSLATCTDANGVRSNIMCAVCGFKPYNPPTEVWASATLNRRYPDVSLTASPPHGTAAVTNTQAVATLTEAITYGPLC